MNKDRYSIIFNSKTGNTRKLADAIHEALPQENCDLFGAVEGDVPASETLYIGFWTDKGSADKATAELLAKLKNRKIFLFGTAGFGGSEEYFTNILDNVKKLINESNTVVGEYMCQGRMPGSVRARYGLSVHKNSSTLYDKNRAMFLTQADYFTSTSSILKFSSNNLLVLNFI